MTTYITLVMVEFGQLLQPAHAKLQAALEQQHANCTDKFLHDVLFAIRIWFNCIFLEHWLDQ